MKKILAMVVAMVMVLGMVGCGKSEASTSSDNRERAENVEVVEGTVNAPTEKVSEHGKVVYEEHYEYTGDDLQPNGNIEIVSEHFGFNAYMGSKFGGSINYYEYEDGYVETEEVYNEE